MIVQSIPYPASTGGTEPPWSGAPGYIGSGSFTWVDGSVSLDVPYPSGIQFHDVLLLYVVGFENTVGTPTISTPSGWTQIATANIGGSAFFPMAVFWKRADGTESGTQNVTVGGSVSSTSDAKGGMIHCYRGCLASGTPYEGAGSNAANSTNPTGVAVTTTGSDRTVVNVFGRVITGVGIAPAAGWTEQTEQAGTTAASKQGSTALHDKTAASAGTVAAEVTTATSSRWGVVSLALLPR